MKSGHANTLIGAAIVVALVAAAYGAYLVGMNRGMSMSARRCLVGRHRCGRSGDARA